MEIIVAKSQTNTDGWIRCLACTPILCSQKNRASTQQSASGGGGFGTFQTPRKAVNFHDDLPWPIGPAPWSVGLRDVGAQGPSRRAGSGFAPHRRGNLEPALQELTHTHEFLHVPGAIDQSALAKHLGACHLGLLPMPNRSVWALASPLKRSEYLAAGLSVFGIEHDGHALAGSEKTWFKLVPQEDFHLDGLNFIRECMDAMNEVLDAPRAYAETHLGWEHSVTTLERELKDLLYSDS